MENRDQPGPSRGRARGQRRNPVRHGQSVVEKTPGRVRVSPPRRPQEGFPQLTELSTQLDMVTRYHGSGNNEGEPRVARASIDYGARFDFVNTRAEGQDKRGQFGRPLNLVANYFAMKTSADWGAYQYDVVFEPHLEETFQRRAAFRRFQQEDQQGRVMLKSCIFDGRSIWSVHRYVRDMSELLTLATSTPDGTPVLLKVKMVKEFQTGSPEFLQVYNNIVRTCLRALKLTQIGRNYFDPHLEIKIPNRSLTLWPGFITTLRQHDYKDLLYCVEITHKVIRTDRVLDFIESRRSDLRNFGRVDGIQEIITKELVGTVVMTSYNRKTYRVDDVLWKETPGTTFQHDGRSVSLKDYVVQKYNVLARNMQPPILLSNPKKRDIRRGFDTPIKLIPEFCQMTGLTDNMRSDNMLMRELGQHLFQTPDKKVESITNFINRLRNCPEANIELGRWMMSLEPNPLKMQGRQLPPETIIFRNGSTRAPDAFVANESADFTLAFRSKHMVTSTPLEKWVIIVPARDFRNVDILLSTMLRVATPIGFQLGRVLEIMQLQDIRARTYVDSITAANNKYGASLQLVFVILPTNRADIYAAVKKRCYIDLGLSSQCFLGKNLTNKGLMSIVTKVIVQINAKLGGEPWNIVIPLKKLMIVGFDVHHGGVGSKGMSVGAMTCTTSASYGKFFSIVSYSNSREELSTKMANDIGRCLVAYQKCNNGALPERIMLYRDGVGEGQLHFVVTSELEAIKEKLASVYSAVGIQEPLFTHIICTKRINARLFLKDRQGFINPSPGTIADNTITLPERFDFFLIAPAARQGTVSPTNYNVIYDRNKLDADKIQRLTFKLCHLYYNWSGSVAVPAVCQYAHKLAYLTGLSLGTEREPNERLTHLLYFL